MSDRKFEDLSLEEILNIINEELEHPVKAAPERQTPAEELSSAAEPEIPAESIPEVPEEAEAAEVGTAAPEAVETPAAPAAEPTAVPVSAPPVKAAPAAPQRVSAAGSVPARAKAPKRKKLTFAMLFSRIMVAVCITAILCLCGGLGVEYVLVKGPSPSLRDTFVMTMLETRRFGFIPSLLLSQEEIDSIRYRNTMSDLLETDPSLINVGNAGAAAGVEELSSVRPLVDEDGDGVILEYVKGRTYMGYMLIVLDPGRIVVGAPDYYGGVGLTMEQMCKKYDTQGGINGGGFMDVNGTGLGGTPAGLTVIDGVYYNEDTAEANFVGFDEQGILHCGYMTADIAREKGIRNGVSFGPVLVSNGEAADSAILTSGINPRTAIGQRADGAVLMLVIDGRQVSSLGATYGDVAELMLEYGAVNACNLDGGSSSTMYLHGEYINNCSSAGGARPLPTAFMFR